MQEDPCSRPPKTLVPMGVLGLELSGVALFLGIGGEWMKGGVKVQGGREEPDRRYKGSRAEMRVLSFLCGQRGRHYRKE